jgi:peptidoglycan/LPS O-acetylase OafA/YrhL
MNVDKIPRKNALILIISTGFLFLYFIYKIRTEYDLRIGLILMFFICSVLIYSQVFDYPLRERMKNIVAVMASYSFSLYLTHYSIMNFLNIYSNIINFYLLSVISFILSNLIAYIMYFFVERHYKQIQTVFKESNIFKKLQKKDQLI